MKQTLVRSGAYDGEDLYQPCTRIGNVIVLPPNIERSTYNSFLQCLNEYRAESDRTIYLHIYGDGGDMDAAFAIGSLIQTDGNIAGVLAGVACSAHSVIWAMCKERFAMQDSAIGIHRCWITAPRLMAFELRLLAEEMQATENRVLDIYSEASNQSRQWWEDRMVSNMAWLNVLKAKELIEIAMAQPYTKQIQESV